MSDDDLSTKLAVLTDGRPEPADPAAPIRLRITRRRRRRRGTAVVVATAAATAAVLAAGPVLGTFRPAGSEPGVAGFGPPPAITTPMTTATTAPTVVMPPPWSAEVFTKLPDANAYRPRAYYVAKGTIPTETWAVLAFSERGCMVTDEGRANSFGRPYVCFDEWRAGQRADYHAVQGHTKEKGAAKVDATLVMGAVSADARKVALTAGGQKYTVDAVGTPATDRLRFFALVIPDKDVEVTAVTPLDEAGKLAAAPTGVPTGVPCGTEPNAACATATPAN